MRAGCGARRGVRPAQARDGKPALAGLAAPAAELAACFAARGKTFRSISVRESVTYAWLDARYALS
jgi:hypothetical protein